MKRRSLILALSCIVLSSHLHADGIMAATEVQDQPWSVTASFGSSKYQYVSPHHKSRAVGRLALGNELILAGDYALGLEFGVQNGSHVAVTLPKETLNVLGCTPVQTTLGPMLDLLVTAKSDPIGQSLFFAELKGGLAYRHWSFDRAPAADTSKLAGEIQAGLGYPITALANMNVLYQGVMNKKPAYVVNTQQHVQRTTSIPTLHAVLLGLSVNL